MNSCGNCAFWLDSTPVESRGQEEHPQGVCRRFPPQLLSLVGEGGKVVLRSQFPQIDARLVCGEWRPRGAQLAIAKIIPGG